ncbi:hypothetical protein MC916_004049 [Elizabethkingia anophelis]|uniref:hypothetical protein n=1 Tax=Elizabethkingia anophelis TaxID=1117645 RepID=UPI001D681720|nr:hypothetical protein [Elizabethkingia anophelis]EHM7982828.1 hypothetical protein [Elizabethkingia anophelis]EHM8030165.1 hypothetical protein [Elizabethkingia anophelis]EHM8034169.1 hypothetical protein [Elizabethkingia anophelis]EHZ9532919.1 hypothetical protein [Elizabethkingia anophelis]EKU3670829.1 hypothetical protein [Elizabethkingia anophelis]
MAILGIIMVVSAIAPFLFLTKYERKQIGITKSSKYSWLIVSFFLGLAFSILLYTVGDLIYKNTLENWYVYIGLVIELKLIVQYSL